MGCKHPSGIRLEIFAEERISSSTRTRVAELLEIIKVTKELEKDAMCVFMCTILTSISLDIDRSNDDVLAFVPNSSKILPEEIDETKYEPDLIAFFNRRNVADQVAGGNIDEKSVSIPPAHLLVAPMELRDSETCTKRCLRYIHALSRHRPASSLQYGMTTNKNSFQLLALGLNEERKWEEVLWDNDHSIDKLYTCIELILREARKDRAPAAPRIAPTSVYEVDETVLAIYRATVGEKDYHLLPIYYGRGYDRKPFVAIAIPIDGPTDNSDIARIFKYSWYADGLHRRDHDLLKKLKGVPGVVQIDETLSRVSVDVDESSGYVRTLLALKTVGCPLCSCSSVLEFLEAMYDLLEVLRYLVQEKNVLYRDISWGNVLIRPEHASDVEISIRSEPTDEVIRHNYRFISDIFPDDDGPRVRVAIADFDYSSDLSSASEEELKEATGTPMFMANDVAFPNEGERPFGSAASEQLRQAAVEDCELKYADVEEKGSWDAFYSNLNQVNFIHTEDPGNFFRHGAMHDAESVFYLCLLFFNRMQRSSAHKETSTEEQERNWGEGFEKLASKRFRNPTTRHSSLLGVFPISFDNSFVKMLKTISLYLEMPWYNVATTRRGERHEFHLHDFMQRLILKEIRKLRPPNGDPIAIESAPRRVRMLSQQYGNAYATSTKAIFGNKTTDDDKAKPKAKEASALKRVHRGVVTRGQEILRAFHEKHFEILLSKKRERLWLVADKWA